MRRRKEEQKEMKEQKSDESSRSRYERISPCCTLTLPPPSLTHARTRSTTRYEPNNGRVPIVSVWVNGWASEWTDLLLFSSVNKLLLRLPSVIITEASRQNNTCSFIASLWPNATSKSCSLPKDKYAQLYLACVRSFLLVVYVKILRRHSVSLCPTFYAFSSGFLKCTPSCWDFQCKQTTRTVYATQQCRIVSRLLHHCTIDVYSRRYLHSSRINDRPDFAKEKSNSDCEKENRN